MSPRAGTVTLAEAKARAVFVAMDKNGDGAVDVREFILALRRSSDGGAALARYTGMPARVRQEDGTREAFERVFQDMDANGDRMVTWPEFAAYCARRRRASAAARRARRKKQPRSSAAPTVNRLQRLKTRMQRSTEKKRR